MYSPRITFIEDAASLSPEEFTLSRRLGFGASDSSVLLGINHWDTLEDLIAQKNTEGVTESEIEVGNKPQVRMGHDLEPLIISKAQDFLGAFVYKDTNTYYLLDYPQLTINYDGVIGGFDKEYIIPVECKCVSPYGRKYWDFSKAQLNKDELAVAQKYGSARSIQERIAVQAQMIGIPEYYYTQIQQQLLGTNMTYAWLAALDVKEWNLHMFKIMEDEDVQEAIITSSLAAMDKCPKIEDRCIKY